MANTRLETLTCEFGITCTSGQPPQLGSSARPVPKNATHRGPSPPTASQQRGTSRRLQPASPLAGHLPAGEVQGLPTERGHLAQRSAQARPSPPTHPRMGQPSPEGWGGVEGPSRSWPPSMEPSPNTHRPSVHKARVGLVTPPRMRKTKLHRIRSWPGPHVAERRQSGADTPVEGGGREEGLSVVGGRWVRQAAPPSGLCPSQARAGEPDGPQTQPASRSSFPCSRDPDRDTAAGSSKRLEKIHPPRGPRGP